MEEKDNKYYTPTIKEFHVGFEFEIINEYKNNIYSKVILENDSSLLIDNKDHWEYEHMLSNIEYDIKNNNIRVKFLDKSDIESLGFKPDHVGTIHHDKGFDMMLFDNHNISIYGSDPYNNNTLFMGIIKNKSELVILLKQLNIL